ncbi:hypothetical protein C8R43DRAFT_1024369 [Mycena crocata]|nr:hypothetical protein C8R43DRAFT_1024369 [Mycena crocata]
MNSGSTPSRYTGDGGNGWLRVNSDILVILPTPPTNTRDMTANMDASPISDGVRSDGSFSPPSDSSLYSPLSESPYSPGNHTHPFASPFLPPFQSTHTMFGAMSLDATFPDSENSSLSSPLEFQRLPSLRTGSDELSPLHSLAPLPDLAFPEDAERNSAWSDGHEHFQNSLLFTIVPARGPLCFYSEVGPSYMELQRSTWHDIASTTSTNDQLMVQPRRHSFSTQHEGSFFLSPATATSTPDTSYSSFPSSPDVFEGAGPLQHSFVHAPVASPATVRAANLRRKKKPSFRCEREGCYATLTTRHNLKNHYNAHDGIKPHLCIACKSKFTTLGVLKRHQKTCRSHLAASH